MFGRLSDFGHQRSLVQALGFYLAYLVAGIVLLALVGGMAGLLVSGVGFDSGLMIGTVGAIIMSPTLSLLVLRAKGQLGHIGFLLAALLSGVGAAFGGLILGLAFVAFLTTRPSRLTGYALPAQTGHRAAI
jgi:hypothetical protein